jgi:5-hydroxyisourate hydrolase/2-oxo-4-hydroxy-4-carboxy-5-ureidoimidazoline decarboxylase
MAGKLSTHVLDTTTGRPAAGVPIELWYLGPLPASGETEAPDAPHRPERLASTITNGDGRTDEPLLSATTIRTGYWRLQFAVGAYFAHQKNDDAHAFLDIVPVEFTINDATRPYHVPLLVTPWSYSTYRGS